MPPSVIPSVFIDQIAAADLTTALAARAEIDAALKVVAWRSFAALAPAVKSVSINDFYDGWLLKLDSGRTLCVHSNGEPSDFKEHNSDFYGLSEAPNDSAVLINLRIALAVPSTGEHSVAMTSLREFLTRLHQHLSVIYPLHEAS